jgi:hypothetical protein
MSHFSFHILPGQILDDHMDEPINLIPSRPVIQQSSGPRWLSSSSTPVEKAAASPSDDENITISAPFNVKHELHMGNLLEFASLIHFSL